MSTPPSPTNPIQIKPISAMAMIKNNLLFDPASSDSTLIFAFLASI
jgi:hypothetical protein